MRNAGPAGTKRQHSRSSGRATNAPTLRRMRRRPGAEHWRRSATAGASAANQFPGPVAAPAAQQRGSARTHLTGNVSRGRFSTAEVRARLSATEARLEDLEANHQQRLEALSVRRKTLHFLLHSALIEAERRSRQISNPTDRKSTRLNSSHLGISY